MFKLPIVAGCTSNAECTTDGVRYCDTTSGSGICRMELCETSDDCITAGYVCQNPPGICIQSCKTDGLSEFYFLQFCYHMQADTHNNMK